MVIVHGPGCCAIVQFAGSGPPIRTASATCMAGQGRIAHQLLSREHHCQWLLIAIMIARIMGSPLRSPQAPRAGLRSPPPHGFGFAATPIGVISSLWRRHWPGLSVASRHDIAWTPHHATPTAASQTAMRLAACLSLRFKLHPSALNGLGHHWHRGSVTEGPGSELTKTASGSGRLRAAKQAGPGLQVGARLSDNEEAAAT